MIIPHLRNLFNVETLSHLALNKSGIFITEIVAFNNRNIIAI